MAGFLLLPTWPSICMVSVQAFSQLYKQLKAGSRGKGFNFAKEQVEHLYCPWIPATSQASTGPSSLTLLSIFAWLGSTEIRIASRPKGEGAVSPLEAEGTLWVTQF